MLHRTSNGGDSTTRPVALTLKGQIAVALYRIEGAIDSLTEAEQQDLLAELLPIAQLARSRAEVRQSRRGGSPLVGRITA
jgi:hypothetical protein